jgi:hypothetical protein
LRAARLFGICWKGAGSTESKLAPVRDLPLQQLVALSRGQLPQSVLDDLVMQANAGVVPIEDSEESEVWQEHVTPGAESTARP